MQAMTSEGKQWQADKRKTKKQGSGARKKESKVE